MNAVKGAKSVDDSRIQDATPTPSPKSYENIGDTSRVTIDPNKLMTKTRKFSGDGDMLAHLMKMSGVSNLDAVEST